MLGGTVCRVIMLAGAAGIGRERGTSSISPPFCRTASHSATGPATQKKVGVEKVNKPFVGMYLSTPRWAIFSTTIEQSGD